MDPLNHIPMPLSNKPVSDLKCNGLIMLPLLPHTPLSNKSYWFPPFTIQVTKIPPSFQPMLTCRNFNGSWKHFHLVVSIFPHYFRYRKFSNRGAGRREKTLGGAPIRESAFPPFSGFLQNENRTIFG